MHQSNQSKRCPQVCLTVPVLPLFLSKTIPSPLNRPQPSLVLGHGVSRFNAGCRNEDLLGFSTRGPFLFRFFLIIIFFLIYCQSRAISCGVASTTSVLLLWWWGKWRQCLDRCVCVCTTLRINQSATSQLMPVCSSCLVS